MTHGSGAVSNQRKHQLLDIDGVTSVGEAMAADGSVVLRVRVDPDDRPDMARIPDAVEGTPVEVLASAVELLAASAADAQELPRTDRHRPVVAGTSTSPLETPREMAGTIGAVLTDGQSDYIISNGHVWNTRESGDIAQPANLDGATSDDVVATFVGTGTGTQFGDADFAIAELSGETEAENRVAGIGPITGWREVGIGDAVEKSGRTSGITSGTVIETNVAVDTGQETLEEQIITTAPVEGGDSGSPLLVDGDRFGGLVWAKSGTDSIVSPAGAVLALAERLAGAELKTTGSGGVDADADPQGSTGEDGVPDWVLAAVGLVGLAWVSSSRN